MKRDSVKKSISLLLAIIMIVSLLPTIAFAKDNVFDKKWVFNCNTLGRGSRINNHVASAIYGLGPDTDTDTTDAWKYMGIAYYVNSQFETTCVELRVDNKAGNDFGNTDQRSALVFEVSVGQSGWYTPSVSCTNKSDLKLGAYIINKDVADSSGYNLAAQSNDVKKGEKGTNTTTGLTKASDLLCLVSTDGTSLTESGKNSGLKILGVGDNNLSQAMAFDKIKLEKGDYYLVLGVVDGRLSETKTRADVSIKDVQLKFEGIEFPPEDGSGYTVAYNFFDGVPLFSDTTYSDTHNLWKAGGASDIVTVDENGLTFGSDASSYAEIKINVPVTGKYKVMISHASSPNGAVGGVYINGTKVGTVDYTKDTDIITLGEYLFEQPGEQTLKFAYESGSDFLQLPKTLTLFGGTGTYIVDADLEVSGTTASITSAILSDGNEVAPSSLEIKYSFKDAVDGIKIGETTGEISAGDTDTDVTIIAEVSYGGKSIILEKPHTVPKATYSEYSLKYDFVLSSPTAIKLNNALNTPKLLELAKGYWRYHSASRNISTLNAASYGLQLGTSETNSDWVALELNIPAAGLYKTKLTYAKNTSGGMGEIYVFPENTSSIGNAISNNAPIGKVDFHASSQVLGNEAVLDNVFFEAPGKYLLVFNAAISGGKNMYPTSIEFSGGEKKAIISMKNDRAEYSTDVGETTKASAGEVRLSDYSLADEYKVSYYIENEDIATVDENGNITGVSVGETEVTIMTELDGTYASDKSKVTIYATGASRYSIIYDLNTAESFNSASYKNTYNFWKYVSSEGAVEKEDNCISTSGNVEIEINIPVAGNYNISLTHGKSENGANGEVYIGKSPETLVKLGDVNYNSTSETEGRTTLGTFLAEIPGRYVVSFKCSEKQMPGKLTLDGGKNLAPMGIKMQVRNKFVDIEGIVLSDGSLIDAQNATEIRYSIEDEGVAGIDEEKGFIVPDPAGGSTTIYADITYNGITVSGHAEATFSAEEAKAGGAVKTYDFGVASDEWKSNNPHTTNNNGVVTKFYVEGITYESTDGWAWHMVSKDNYRPYSTVSNQAAGIRMEAGKNEWTALKLNIPAEGKYWVDMKSSKSPNTDFGDVEIYFVPVADTREDIEELLSENNFFSVISSEDMSIPSASGVVDELGQVYIPQKGDYLIVFKNTEDDKGAIPWTLTLNGVNGVRTLSVKTDKQVLEVGESTEVHINSRLLDGTLIDKENAACLYSSSDEDVASVENGIIMAKSEGEATISVTISHSGSYITKQLDIEVVDPSGIQGVEVSAIDEGYVGGAVKLSSKLVYNGGAKKRIDNSDVSYTVLSGNATVSDGKLTATTPGEVSFIATVTYKGRAYTSETPTVITFKEATIKNGRSYYTEERMKAFKENIKKYDWAKSTVKNAIAAADERLDDVELLCKFIVGNTLPKAYQLRYIGDQNYYFCTYCGADVETKYGGFEIDSVNKPWKIQCPECKRLFPSNDFELLYERGLDEHGVYNAELAKQRNAEAVARGEKDALVNELYSDLYNPASESYNKDPVTGDVIDGKMWGVDDGWGYKPGRINEDGNEERHHYIALFLETAIGDAMSSCGSLATAYLYTDEEEYGRAAAIILDRFADVYPEASIRDFHELGYPLGGVGQGMFRGSLRDCTIAANVADYIDMVFPLLEQNDEKLIKTLSEKVDKLQLDTPKENGAQIWEYWKKNILIRNYEGLKTGDLRGNLGYQERVAAMTAVALDTEPYSKEIVEWIFKPALVSSDDDWDRFNCEGGNILHNFVNWVDRDGMGSEGSPNYNLTWTYYYDTVAGWLESYDNGKYSLYKNPKFMQMYLAGIPLVLTNNHHPQIGDSGSTAMLEFFDRDAILQRGFYYLKDSPIAKQLAEYIYFRNGNSVRGLHYDMYTPNPESMQHDVLALVGDKQTIEYNESGMVAGYGFAALRDGEISGDENTPTYKNTLRDFYMWFGKNDPSWSHNHLDALNIGVEAYGLNMAPDLGYSESSNAPSRYGWNRKTISHNTVMVNEKDQIFHGATSAPVLHFDSSDGEVQLMDVDAANSYAETSIYRRTVVMINAGPDVSYGVDFFRVKGGENHTYSLHAQSDSVYETEGLGEIHYQTDDGTATGNYVGSYGSPDIEYGPHQSGAKFPGSTWMKNVRQAYDVNKFSVDFDITDFRKVLKNGNDLHLRLTMLNDFTLDEVALTSGHVSQKTENLPMPDQLEYVLARRGGENLDSLFTTVIEPYKGSRYLLDMSDVDIETEGEESEDDTAKAIKVIRKGSNGEADRVDYVIYATNNNLLYKISDADVTFYFRGFVGVYSLDAAGNNVYSYVHDGDIIGATSETTERTKSYTAQVSDYTKDLVTDNFIYITPTGDKPIDTDDLVGRYMFIENGRRENGAYKIESALDCGDGTFKLGVGFKTTILKYKDRFDETRGFEYLIAKGNRVTIPTTYVESNLPVFSPLSDSLTVSAGNTIKVKVSAESKKVLTYFGESLPRGAAIDSNTGIITWKLTASQVGKHSFTVIARDVDGGESSTTFTVTVYGATTGGDNTSSDNTTTDTPSGGGGGGGGAAPTPDKSETEDASGENKADSTDQNGGNTAPDMSGEAENLRFTDLGNHAWASDAINSLADEGIIKGTSDSTYSPANNITRADFALLLVRAFELSSDNSENFSDVDANDYYAQELAIARNTGIINGTGDNKYAPRNAITRQDMMLIVYRALNKLGVEIKASDAAKADTYGDFADVSDCAKEAVEKLVAAGLVNGKSSNIAPKDYTTRAEVAVLIKRILDFIK